MTNGATEIQARYKRLQLQSSTNPLFVCIYYSIIYITPQISTTACTCHSSRRLLSMPHLAGRRPDFFSAGDVNFWTFFPTSSIFLDTSHLPPESHLPGCYTPITTYRHAREHLPTKRPPQCLPPPAPMRPRCRSLRTSLRAVRFRPHSSSYFLAFC